MCIQPCSPTTSGCFGPQFYQCVTCSNSSLTINNGLCLKQPIFIVQIICTFMLIIFILPSLMRKRSVSLIRILDAVQIVSYFKYINGYLPNRHNYLYLGMRSWSEWSQGWNLVSLAGDVSLPVWKIEETAINKIIRIGIIWVGVLSVMLVMAIIKTAMGDSQITFSTYISKNLPIAFCIGFYINVQDMALIMANAYNSALTSSPFVSKQMIVQLGAGIVFTLVILIVLAWMFYRINFNYMNQLQKTPRKIYAHVYMFMLALDYDLFQSYELTNLPQQEKRICRYSNLRLFEVFKKIAYSFLIVNSLYTPKEILSGQVFSILGLLIFFDVLWYVGLPYDVKTEKTQLVLSVLADLLTLAILLIPLFYPQQIIQMSLCLSLLGLGILSAFLQYFLDVYKIIPVDLYETGLSVVIEDKRLLRQIQQRKHLQDQNQRKLRQMQEQNKKLKQQLSGKQKLKDQTQHSLPNLNPEPEQGIRDQPMREPYYAQQDGVEKTSMNSDDVAELYRIDDQKRRKIYQFNKKATFTYSNKIDY